MSCGVPHPKISPHQQSMYGVLPPIIFDPKSFMMYTFKIDFYGKSYLDLKRIHTQIFFDPKCFWEQTILFSI